jgi:hypothetical protein
MRSTILWNVQKFTDILRKSTVCMFGCSSHSLTLKMEDIYFCETSVNLPDYMTPHPRE